jgi:hypothetical protein
MDSLDTNESSSIAFGLIGSCLFGMPVQGDEVRRRMDRSKCPLTQANYLFEGPADDNDAQDNAEF